MLNNFIIFAALFVSVRSFDYIEFQKKYCYDDIGAKTTAHYFPYSTGAPKTANGYVCENFILTKDDLDYMVKDQFTLSQQFYIFLRNCEIEYFNDNLVTRFPRVSGLFFENCKLSFKNPAALTSNIPNLLYLGFHKSVLNDNLNSLALRRFNQLRFTFIQNTTLEYPIIDKSFLQGNGDLYQLLIDNSNVESFEKGLLSNNRHHINYLTCSSCQLNEVDPMFEEFKFEVQGGIIDFNDNYLTKLPISLTGFRTLPELNLSGNFITETFLERNYFKLMTGLRILDLSRNAKINGIRSLAFKDTILQRLNMSRVNLRTVEKLGNVNIVTIDFSHNKLTKISEDVFEGLTRLSFLDLSYNRLTEFDTSSFKELNALGELRLNNNRIKIINSNLFQGLNNLITLDLNNNFLEILVGIENLRSLQELRLQNNLLKMIPSGLSLPNSLRILDVSKNSLTFTGQNTFSNLGQLTNLDMSYTNSSFNKFLKDSFQPLKSLQVFKFKGNRLHSLEDIYLPITLRELDISFNKIPNITRKGLENLVNLEFLNLTSNHIYEIDDDLMRILPKIRNIDISGNDL